MRAYRAFFSMSICNSGGSQSQQLGVLPATLSFSFLGSLLLLFPFLFWFFLPLLLLPSSPNVFLLVSSLLFFTSWLLFASLFLTFVHKRITALDLRADFYAPRAVTPHQSDTNMGSPSTNGSASREVGGGAWCWRDTPPTPRWQE